MSASKTILLVEDEFIIAMSEAKLLRKAGYEVVQAGTGEEAIALVNANPQRINLILMDINLGPGMDGTLAAQLILREHDIPVLFLSSHNEPDVVEKTEMITSYGYVVKDSGFTVLAASIKMAFRLHAANQALRQTNEALSQAQEASRAGMWIWSIPANDFSWTPEFYQIFQIDRKIPGGIDGLLKVVHPDDRAMLLRVIDETQATFHVPSFDFRVVRGDGEVRWVHATGKTYFEDGQPVRIAGMCIDITERKQVERALEHSRDLMRYVIEHSRSAIAVHDRDLRYIYVSKRYLTEYKVKETDVVGRHHYEVFPDLPQKWRDVHQRALKGEVLSGENDPYVRADGSVDWTRWECRPWFEADGAIGGIIVYTEVLNTTKPVKVGRPSHSIQL